MLVFDRFDAAASGFPSPAVPVLPVLRWRDLTLFSDAASSAAMRSMLPFARGRYALHAACQLAGVGAGTSLVSPAYHCRTMIDGAMALGAEVAFYAQDAVLAPTLAGIAAAIDQAGSPVKALLLPHYFGFPQEPALVEAIAEMCAARGIVLIEDCSHAWQVAVARASTVSRWRMVVASPYKFFATPDGGALWSAAAPAPVQAASATAELKAALRLLRPAPRGPVAVAQAPGTPGITHTETAPRVSAQYASAEAGQAGLAVSRSVMRHTDVARAARRRCENYTTLLAASASLPGARPLFDALPDDCAPYMFPLYLTQPAAHFDALKRRGVPIFRWDDMARTDCPVATDYRLGLLHLPCHQDLDPAQMAWLCTQLTEVLGSAKGARR